MTTEHNFPDEIFLQREDDDSELDGTSWCADKVNELDEKYHHDRVVKALQEKSDDFHSKLLWAEKRENKVFDRCEALEGRVKELIDSCLEKDAEIAELKKRINDAVLQIAILPGVAELIRKEGIKIETI